MCVTGGFSFAILWERSCVYIFDSHSRNEFGEISENGTSVLLKMTDLAAVESYIKHIYLSNDSQYLEIQYIKVLNDPKIFRVISQAVKRKRNRENNNKYHQSASGKKYRLSEIYKTSRKNSYDRYCLSEKGITRKSLSKEKYKFSEKDRVKQKENQKKYQSSEKGCETQKKYQSSEKGCETQKK